MKTIKQAAKEFAESEIMETYDSIIEEMKRISFIHGANFVQQWISVKDELPNIGLKIECKNERDSYYSGIVELREVESIKRIIIRGMFQGTNAIDLLYNFTHWRPIERE